MLLRTLSVAVACLSIPLWADPITVESKVTTGTLAPSKTFKYEPATVDGYMDNQNLIDVAGISKTTDTDILLNRSFKNEMSQNVDKETVERVVE